MLDVRFAASALPTDGALVLLVPEGATPVGLWKAADDATGGAISRAFTTAEFTGKDGQTCTILAPGGGLSRVVAIGLGPLGELTERRVEDAGGTLVPLLAREPKAALAAAALDGKQAARVAFGAALRSYRFDLYRTKMKPEDKPKLAAITVLTPHSEDAAAEWTKLAAVAHGVFVARDLATEPPNVLTPIEFANRIEKLRDLGLTVDVFGPEQMLEWGFGALMGVAQGSAQKPRMVVMQWNGGKPGDKPVAFIGKGVTFDTGRHQHQAGRGHGRHEVGHGRCRRGDRPHGSPRGPQGRGERGGSGRAGGEHARQQRAAPRRRGEELFRPDESRC